MDEFALIEEIIVPRAGYRADVVLGIGDDGAVVIPPLGEELVIVADTLVAGVHFPPQLAPADIGYRAVAVNLSDIAAMGAEPRWATLALTLPEANRDWLTEFMRGMHEALAAHSVQLIGGDTTRGPLTMTVQIIGSVPRGQALTRHGARPGDAIFVSGSLGDAAAGLSILQREPATSEDEVALIQRFARPTARVALGQALRGIASSCIDISDGLLGDLGHIATRSACSAMVDAAKVPASAALLAGHTAAVARDLGLTGGDDYELCFTLPAASLVPHEDQLRRQFDLYRIGTMTDTAAAGEVVVMDDAGKPMQISRRGYRHF